MWKLVVALGLLVCMETAYIALSEGPRRELSWYRASKQNDLDFMGKYLSAYPRGRHTQTIVHRLCGTLPENYGSHVDLNLIETGLERYVQVVSKDGLAKTQLLLVRGERQLQSKDAAGLEETLASLGSSSQSLRQRGANLLEDYRYDQSLLAMNTGDHSKLFNYLKSYPNGRHIKDCCDLMSAILFSQSQPKRDHHVKIKALNPLATMLKLNPGQQDGLALYRKLKRELLPTDVGQVLINSFEMKFTYIPSGNFKMGSPSNEFGHDNDMESQCQVRLSHAFLMQTTEVTQEQWEAVMGNNPSHFKGEANLPVENVSWNDAIAFCQKLSQRDGLTYRLPTEAEWEYACRAGRTGTYGGTGRLDDMGWYDANSDKKTHPVGQKQANAWGLYDMHGNVKEWCSDWYGRYRANMFRILNVAVDVEPNVVRNREKQRAIRIAAGQLLNELDGFPLALAPTPDVEQRKKALDRLLTNPTEQFVNELFWFWPTPEHDGRMLCGPELKQAVQTWQGQLGGKAAHKRQNCIAAHNLAIWHHTRALDAEFHAANDSQQLPKSQDEDWHQALRYWHIALSTDGMLEYLRHRAKELDDPTLTDHAVRSVISDLPNCLLQINVTLAAESLKRNQTQQAKRYIAQLHKSPFDKHQKDAAVEKGADIAGQEIKRICRTAEQQAKADPQHAGHLIRRLHTEISKHLAVIDTFLPQNNVTRAGLHDLAADTLLDCVLPFARKTEDWQGAQQLVSLISSLATGDVVKERATSVGENFKENANSGFDWCKKGYWHLPVSILEALENIRVDREARNWDKAIPALEDVILTHGDDLSQDMLAVVHHCIGLCLCLKGIDLWKSITDTGEKALQVLLDAAFDKLMSLSHDEIIDRINGIERARESLRMGRHAHQECFGCGHRVGASLVRYTYRDIPMMFCSTCGAKLDAAQNCAEQARKHAFRETLPYAVVANDFDPNDKGISNDLEKSKQGATKLGVAIPHLEKATKALKLRVAPPTLQEKWKRAQAKARQQLTQAKEIRDQVTRLCERIRSQIAEPPQDLHAYACKEFEHCLKQLAQTGQMETYGAQVRVAAVEALLTLDAAVQWSQVNLIEHVQFLESVVSIAGETSAAASAKKALKPLEAKAASIRRIFKLKVGLVGVLSAASVLLGWFIFSTMQP